MLFGALSIAPTHAQDGAISAGEPQTILLSAEQTSVTLIYSAQGGETISIRAEAVPAAGDAPLPDSVIRVIDPEGRQIAYADHDAIAPVPPGTGQAGDARIDGLRLAAPGDYAVWISSYGEVGVGRVRVLLDRIDLFDTAESGGAGSAGRVINGRLPSGMLFTHTLDLTAGSTVTLTARDASGTLDPRLRLFDSTGRLVAANDDHGTADLTLNVFDARIVTTITAPGAYILQLSDFLGRAGRFSLDITVDEAAGGA